MSSAAWNKLFQETEIVIGDGQNLARAAKNIQELRKDGTRIGGPVYSKRIKQLSDSLEIQKSLANGDLVQAQKILKMSGRGILPAVREAVEQAQLDSKNRRRPISAPVKEPAIIREKPITRPVPVEKDKKPIVYVEPETEEPIEELQPISQKPIQEEQTPQPALPAEPEIIQPPMGTEEVDLSEEAIDKLLLENAGQESNEPSPGVSEEDKKKQQEARLLEEQKRKEAEETKKKADEQALKPQLQLKAILDEVQGINNDLAKKYSTLSQIQVTADTQFDTLMTTYQTQSSIELARKKQKEAQTILDTYSGGIFTGYSGRALEDEQIIYEQIQGVIQQIEKLHHDVQQKIKDMLSKKAQFTEPDVGFIKEEPVKTAPEPEKDIEKLLEEAAGWGGEEPSTLPEGSTAQEEIVRAEQKRQEEERTRAELERKRKEAEELEKSLTMVRVQVSLFEQEYKDALAKVQGVKNFIAQKYYNELNERSIVAQMERIRVQADRQVKIAKEQLQTTQESAQKVVALIPPEHPAMIAGVQQKVAHMQSLVKQIGQLYKDSNQKFQEILNKQEHGAEATRVATEAKRKIDEEAYKSASQEQKKLINISAEVAKIDALIVAEQQDLQSLDITSTVDLAVLKQRREVAHTQALLAQTKVEEARSVLKAIEGVLGRFTASEDNLERKKFREIKILVEHIQTLDDQNKRKLQEIEREQQRLAQEQAAKERVPAKEAASTVPATTLPAVKPEPARPEEAAPVIPATTLPAKEIGIGEGSKIKEPVTGELSPVVKKARPRTRKPRISPELTQLIADLTTIKDKVEEKYLALQGITFTADINLEELNKNYAVQEDVARAKALQEEARKKASGDAASRGALATIDELVRSIENFNAKINVLLRNIAQKQTDLAEAKQKEEAKKQAEERKKTEDARRNIESAKIEENRLGPIYSQLQEMLAAAEKACKDTGDAIFGRGWAQPSVGVIVSAKNKYIEAKNKRQETVNAQLMQAEALGKRIKELDSNNTQVTKTLGAIRDLAENIKRVDDACILQLQQWEDTRRENRAITR